MCAVIGALIRQPTESDLQLIRNVFLESSIRGLHATGMSILPHWSKNIQTFIEPVAAEKFIPIHLEKSSDEYVNADGNLYLIGHCRYSTSDLKYNQPLYNDRAAIVHNGVISQELYENWESLYHIKTRTKNDSELLLHTIENEPLQLWKNASIAAIELHHERMLIAYRNGKRPIYLTKLKNGYIITSTADIMNRASNGKYKSKMLKMNQRVVMTAEDFSSRYIPTDLHDLQIH